MMPDGAGEARADQLATLGVIAHGDLGARDARAAGAGGRGRPGRSIRGAPPTCARCAAPGCTPPRCRPISSRRARAPPRPARWSGARRARTTISRCCRRSPRCWPHARGRRGQGGGARLVALRRAARRVRAGRLRRATSTRCSPSCAACCPTCSAAPGTARSASRAARRSTGRFPSDQQRTLGVKLMRRSASTSPTAGSTSAASVLRRRRRRRAHHHALRRGRFRPRPDGRAARDRPCPLRGRPAADGGTSRSATRAAWACTRASRCWSRCRPAAAARSSPSWRRAARGVRPGRAGMDGREPPPRLHPGRAGLHPGRCRRGDLSAAHHAALPAGARDDRGRPRAGRPAGRLERRHARAARHRAARRPRGLPAGHPLAGRRLGLFPDLHAGRAGGGPAVRRGQQGRARPPGGLGKGDFAPLLGWLRANVHGKGSIAETDEILGEATGAPLGTAAFKAHLESRYLSA